MNVPYRICYLKAICIWVFLWLVFISQSIASQADSLNYRSYIANDGEYTYRAVTNDPLGVRIYTLDNGLKVYLSQNRGEPSIETYIAVNTGAGNDPEHATGLAHYLEHIMFKGTSDFGTQNWSREKVLLDSLETMFEHYRTLTDREERRAWYARIDQLSQEAAQYAIPNEYDKLISELGASGTNAYTNFDETVYINNIPSNQLENWLRLEANRFSEIVPRLFHTELETVYEEKNRMPDTRHAFQTLMETMFEHHPYGTRTVIGTAEHLKNPSIREIKTYFEKYYVPDNTAIVLAGDFDYDRTIRLIDTHFGSWEKGTATEKKEVYEPERPIQGPVVKEVYGPSAESVIMAFRLPARNSKDYLRAEMVNMILGSKVGLLNLNLNQKQKVQGAGTGLSGMEDYSIHSLYGMPKRGQSLEEVSGLVKKQLELIKQGRFDEWLPAALVADLKKREMGSMSSNRYRASEMLTSFTRRVSREDRLREYAFLKNLSKEDIMEFARKYYNDSYVIVYKRKGEPDFPKVEKPEISSIKLNKEISSEFYRDILDNETEPISPVFLDFENDIRQRNIHDNVKLLYVENKLNDLFTLSFEIEKGGDGDPRHNLALEYLDYLGTGQLTSEDFKKELFKQGCDFNVSDHNDHTHITVSGLNENMQQALDLVLQLIRNPKPDEQALEGLKQRILQSRANAKQSERTIQSKLNRYVMYGPPNSQMVEFLTEDELNAVTSGELIERITNLPRFEQYVSYHGPRSSNEIVNLMRKIIDPKSLVEVPEEPVFTLRKVEEPAVYWVDYDKVQADIYIYFRGRPFDIDRMAESSLYNTYFGSGMSSVIFQELREARGLAYTVHAGYNTASRQNEFDYYSAYIGTQADKLSEALPAMLELIREMPHSENGFNAALTSVLNNLRTERITGYSIINRYVNARNMGINYDIRRDIYGELETLVYDDIAEFHRSSIQNEPAAVMVLGRGELIDFEALGKYGPVRELSLDEIFGY